MHACRGASHGRARPPAAARRAPAGARERRSGADRGGSGRTASARSGGQAGRGGKRPAQGDLCRKAPQLRRPAPRRRAARANARSALTGRSAAWKPIPWASRRSTALCGRAKLGTNGGLPGGVSGWRASSARTAEGVSGWTRFAARRAAAASALDPRAASATPSSSRIKATSGCCAARIRSRRTVPVGHARRASRTALATGGGAAGSAKNGGACARRFGTSVRVARVTPTAVAAAATAAAATISATRSRGLRFSPRRYTSERNGHLP